jgi:hypothetical protein
MDASETPANPCRPASKSVSIAPEYGGLVGMLGIDSASIVILVKPSQAAMAEAFDHMSM